MNDLIQETKRRENQIELSTTLAQKINEAYAAYNGMTNDVLNLALQIENRRIKLGTLLHTAKGAIKHGLWLQWLKDNCSAISHDSASDYIKFAKAAEFKEIDSLENLKAYHKLLVHLGLKEASNGHGQQTLHDWNAFSLFTKVIGNTRKTITEIFDRKPLDQWTDTDKEQLKEQLEPLVDYYYKL